MADSLPLKEKFVVEYLLCGMLQPISAVVYSTTVTLPNESKENLPSIENFWQEVEAVAVVGEELDQDAS